MARLRALGSSSLLLTRRRIERSLAGLCSPGRAACIVFVFCAVAAISSLAASTFTTVVNFKVTNGARPRHASLAQGLDGKLYGTTPGGGAHLYGTVFTLSGPLYSFCAQANCTDGSAPSGGLVLATDGDFYGTTGLGGANGDGTVFKITHSGTLTTLYSFCSKINCTDGEVPYAGVVQGTDGNFYGTTNKGGVKKEGTVFKITPSGKLTTLYSFCSQTSCTDGAAPFAALVQANGNFYGTTNRGGTHGGGTVFKITPSGKLTTLYSFCALTSCTDGGFSGEDSAPVLVQGDRNFYGTTPAGGANGVGTVFKITPSGKLTTLYSFCSQTTCTDGANPLAGLVQAMDGNLYGTTVNRGAHNRGTVFKITPSGALTTLYSLCSQTNCTDGANPYGGLIQATNGTFYGTTELGGANGDGTVFRLSVGLSPFVETLPTLGKVGAAVYILGTNLTSASNVSFGSTGASFTVISASEITTVVPNGATTDLVSVTTTSRTLNSNKIFRVIPQITGFAPTSGPRGTSVNITGVSLSQTDQVSFGGVKAYNFTANSDTQVTATVGFGKTGKVAITTPGCTATSSGEFTLTECLGLGSPCSNSLQCCSFACVGRCCAFHSAACTNDDQCCSGNCVSGRCN